MRQRLQAHKILNSETQTTDTQDTLTDETQTTDRQGTQSGVTPTTDRHPRATCNTTEPGIVHLTAVRHVHFRRMQRECTVVKMVQFDSGVYQRAKKQSLLKAGHKRSKELSVRVA